MDTSINRLPSVGAVEPSQPLTSGHTLGGGRAPVGGAYPVASLVAESSGGANKPPPGLDRWFLLLRGLPTAAGSIVMAVGILGLGALQQMPLLQHALTEPVAIGLFAVWILIVNSYVASWRHGSRNFRERSGHPAMDRHDPSSDVTYGAPLILMFLLADAVRCLKNQWRKS